MPFFHTPLSQLSQHWRIFYEDSASLNAREERTDFEEIRGTYDTRIYRHDQNTLAVSSDLGKTQARLRSLPGLTPKNGSVFVFPDSLLDTVAQTIRAKYKRQYTPEQLAEIQARLPQRQKSGTQEQDTALKQTIDPE